VESETDMKKLKKELMMIVDAGERHRMLVADM
jgi:hypothetical protein